MAVGSFAPSRGFGGTIFLPVVTHWATILRPYGLGRVRNVAPLNPLEGIKAAVTRQTLDGKHPNGWNPEQKLTVDEAVRAFTVGSAYAEFAEKVKGIITPGKLADLIMLDRDLYQINQAEIDKARVLLTVMDGQVVWEAR